MNTIVLRHVKPLHILSSAMAITLIASGAAFGDAALTIAGPGDNGGQFNGGGTIIDCSITGTDIGIHLQAVSNAHVLRYEVKNCEIGILITGGNGNHLNNLFVHDAEEDGLRMEGNTTENHVNNSNFSSNGGYGIHLKSGSNGNRFQSITANSNNSGGYDCDNALNNVMTSTRLIENTGYGAHLESGCNNNIVRSTFITNTVGIGIQIKGDANTVQANKITGSSAEGIKLKSEAEDNLVLSNQVNNNGTQGIENAGDRNTFRSNTVNGNVRQGIQMELNANLNLIKSNTAKNNGDVDLQDQSPGCGDNTWQTNNFVTADPASCIN